MEKLFNPYDKECMKMAMLKHEETFREQVFELHRLYQLQKILMKNIGNSKTEEKDETNDHRTKYIPDDHETGLELTLGLGPTSTRAQARARSTSFSSSSSASGSNHLMKRNDSAMKNANTRPQELIGWQWGMGLDHPNVVHSNSRKNGPNIEDRHSNPPWLLQALSLNTS